MAGFLPVCPLSGVSSLSARPIRVLIILTIFPLCPMSVSLLSLCARCSGAVRAFSNAGTHFASRSNNNANIVDFHVIEGKQERIGRTVGDCLRVRDCFLDAVTFTFKLRTLLENLKYILEVNFTQSIVFGHYREVRNSHCRIIAEG